MSHCKIYILKNPYYLFINCKDPPEIPGVKCVIWVAYNQCFNYIK